MLNSPCQACFNSDKTLAHYTDGLPTAYLLAKLLHALCVWHKDSCLWINWWGSSWKPLKELSMLISEISDPVRSPVWSVRSVSEWKACGTAGTPSSASAWSSWELGYPPCNAPSPSTQVHFPASGPVWWLWQYQLTPAIGNNGLPLPLCRTLVASCLCGSFLATTPCLDGDTFCVICGLPPLPWLLQSSLFMTFCFAPGICKELFQFNFWQLTCHWICYHLLPPLMVHLLNYLGYGYIWTFFGDPLGFLGVFILFTGFTALAGLGWSIYELWGFTVFIIAAWGTGHGILMGTL